MYDTFKPINSAWGGLGVVHESKNRDASEDSRLCLDLNVLEGHKQLLSGSQMQGKLVHAFFLIGLKFITAF